MDQVWLNLIKKLNLKKKGELNITLWDGSENLN